ADDPAARGDIRRRCGRGRLPRERSHLARARRQLANDAASSGHCADPGSRSAPDDGYDSTAPDRSSTHRAETDTRNGSWAEAAGYAKAERTAAQPAADPAERLRDSVGDSVSIPGSAWRSASAIAARPAARSRDEAPDGSHDAAFVTAADH